MNYLQLHTAIVQEHLSNIPQNALINARPPEISATERQLPRATRRTLAQLRAQKCPLLQEYLHSIGAAEVPSCPLCGLVEHDTRHLFQCEQMRTTLTPEDLWRRPVEVSELVDRWRTRLEELEEGEEA